MKLLLLAIFALTAQSEQDQPAKAAAKDIPFADSAMTVNGQVISVDPKKTVDGTEIVLPTVPLIGIPKLKRHPDSELNDVDAVKASPGKDLSPARPQVSASTGGFSTLGEYLRNAPALQREQQAASVDLAAFRKKMEGLEVEYRQADLEYGRREKESRNALARMESENGHHAPAPVAASKVASAPAYSPAEPSNTEQAPRLHAAADTELPAAFAEEDSLDESRGFKPVLSDSTPENSSPGSLSSSADSEDSGSVAMASSIAGTPEGEKGVASRKPAAGKSALRDTIRNALARRARGSARESEEARASESASQSAARSAIAEMRSLASVTTAPADNRNTETGLKLDTSETAAEIARLRSEVEGSRAALEVLDQDSPALFERVRRTHVRSQKDGRVSVVRR